MTHSRFRSTLLLLAAFGLAGGSARADELSGTTRRMHRTFAGPASGAVSGTSNVLNFTLGEGGALPLGPEQEFVPGFTSIANYPGTIADLTAQTGNASGQIKLAWTAPGADGNLGTATSYRVRVSSLPIPDQTTFENLAPYNQNWVPPAAGGPENRVVGGLSPGVTYYVSIEAVDATGVHAFLSNVPSAMPPTVLGQVSYLGYQGGPIAVGVFTSTDFFSPSAFFDSRSQPYPGAFALGSFPFSTPFYVAAFVDMNKNGRPDSGEHFTPYGGSVTPTAIAVAPGTIRTGVDFTVAAGAVAQAAVVQGTITYSGSVTGQLRVELHGEPFFSGTPIAVFRSTSSAGFWSAVVPGGAGYFVRAFVDRNVDGVLQNTEPSALYGTAGVSVDQVFVTANSTVTAVNMTLFDAGHDGGQGTATVTPSTAAAGGLYTSTFSVRVGVDPVTAGGRFVLSSPAGWGQFQTQCSTCSGYVALTVLTTGTAVVTLEANSGSAASAAEVQTGALNPGDTVQFLVSSLAVPCVSTSAAFGVATSQGTGTQPKGLVAGAPYVDVLPGTAVSLSLAPSIPTLVQSVLSDVLVLNTLDRCGSVSAVKVTTTVVVTGALYDFVSGTYSFDPTTAFSSNTVLTATAPLNLSFKVGRSSTPFYAITTSTSARSFQFDFNLTGLPDKFYAPVEVLQAAAISSAAVSTAAFYTGLSSATLSPDGDGANDQAYLSFTLGAPNLTWAVGIASEAWTNTTNALWTATGRGSVSPGDLSWDGRFNQGTNAGQTAPLGTYYVRVAAGGSYDDTLTLLVDAAQIAGQVTDAETLPVASIPGARVAVFGPVVSQTVADDNGRYVIGGLSTGTYTVTFSRSGYRPLALSADVAASTETEVNGPLQRASLLLVTPTLQAGATQSFEQRGRIAVHTAGWDRAYFGPVRLPAGSSIFDDGGQWDPVLQRFIVRTRLRFEVEIGTYTVDAALPGYVGVSTTVYFGAVGLSLTLPAFVPNANVDGSLRLSTATTLTPNPNGVTVTVQAVDVSYASAPVGGIASVVLPPNSSSSTWHLTGVPPGSYRVTASAPGFAAVTYGPVVVGASDVTGVTLPDLTQGTVLTGVVTVNGDTRSLPVLSGSSLTVSVALNAWSPQTYAQGGATVYVASAALSGSAAYSMSGLLPGATYVVFARVSTGGGPAYDSVDTLPRQVYLAPASTSAALDLTFAPSSGTLAGSLTLPASPTPDFTQVSLYGKVLNSPDPFEQGTTFEYLDATALPGFSAGSATAATFKLGNLRNQVLELTAHYRATGLADRRTVAVVGGSTTTYAADLSSVTYTVSGRINDRVSDPSFNTNAQLVANALFYGPAGYPAGVSSTTARVEAVRREFGEFTTALATATFDAAKTRVGFITAAGTYSVNGLTPGVYLVRTLPLRALTTGPIVVPAQEQLVTITTASASNVDFTLTDGLTVTGNLILDGGLQDAVAFSVELLNDRQDLVASTQAVIGSLGGGIAANSVSFSFSRVPAGGFYALRVRDLSSSPRYVGQPLTFPNPTIAPNGLQGDRTGLDVRLKRAASVIGRLRDANTGALITQANATLLPANFSVFALANPFLQGGYTVAAASASARPVEYDGTFRLTPLFPGVPYDLHMEQLGWDLGYLGQGAQNYAPNTIAGLTLQPGQVLDLGVVDLRQGALIAGTVTSTDGVKLANIPISAVPSFVRSPVVVRTQTGPDGAFRLWVSSGVSRYYDVTAAPRDAASAGFAYAEQTLKNVDLTKSATANFELSGLGSAVIGRVLTADGQPLVYPFGTQKGFPAAAVFLQPVGTLPEKNLFGDITAQTLPDGTFSVPGLSTGTYVLRAASLGYAFASTTVTVSGGPVDVGDLTLELGGTVRGDIAKQDPNSPSGFSCPNDREVAGVAGADVGFDQFVVGTVEVDPQNLSVCRYTMTGFKAGVRYQLALLDPSGDAVFPAEGAVTFSVAELRATKNVNLTFRPSPVDCFATGKSLGNNQLQLRFRCTKPLRNLTDPDNDLSLILAKGTATAEGVNLRFPDGNGALPLTEKRIESGRRELTALYVPAVGEGRFSVRLTAVTAFVDPNTGAEFKLDKVFDFFTGVQAVKSQEGTNVSGVNVSLEAAGDEEERSGVVCGPGSFRADGDSQAKPGLNVEVGMQKAETRSQAQILASKRRTVLTAAEESVFTNPNSVPPLIAQARKALSEERFGLQPADSVAPQAAKHPPSVDPLSAFYNVFLPAGIRSTLEERCRLRLSYETSLTTYTANPTQLNVWFFNPLTNKYELMDADKTLDTTNKTITVSVPHFSVYVVLASTPVAESTNPFTGGDLEVFNFPNPFNLERKTKSLNLNAGGGSFGTGAASVTTEGTVIRAGVPRGLSGEGKLRVFDVAGELVRTYDLGTLTGNTAGGGTWYYFEWDGRNQGGNKVASGLYVGEFQVGGKKKFFKMVVIKDSKYK